MSTLRRLRRPSEATTRRTPWAWAVAGSVLGALLVLVLLAPARWLGAGLARATNGRVQLTEPAGTVWSGSSRLVLTGGAGSHDSTALPGRIEWQLRPSLTGVRMRLSADCCTPGGAMAANVSLRWGGAQVSIADGQSQWPASLLTGLGTPWNTVQPRGDLTLATRGLALAWVSGRTSVAGSADITARHLSSRLTTLQPMGSYRAQITGGDAVTLQLSTLEGGLRLSGHGRWVGSRLRFRGEATAGPGLEAQLANLLNILGRRQGDRALISLG